MGNDRLKRERRTIRIMMEIYCRKRHKYKESLCKDCASLLNYAYGRIEKCPFQHNKPVCSKCRIHCYKQSMRREVRRVMRYAGPRMMFYHPVLALFHFIDGTKQVKKRRK